MSIPALRGITGIGVVEPHELSESPHVVVRLGLAPDGLPWFFDVDRSARVARLFHTVASVFDVDEMSELPVPVRLAVEGDLARALMGMHEVRLEQRHPVKAFVSRRRVRDLLGPTVVERLLAPKQAKRLTEPELTAHTGISAVGYAEALDEAIARNRSGRHLLVTVDGEAWTGTVTDAERAVRVPQGPYRRVLFESLPALEGATAQVRSEAGSWTVAMADSAGYSAALARATQATHGGMLQFEVPRTTVLRILIDVARSVAMMHTRGVVHADLNPSNVLLDGACPVLPDALEVPVGEVAVAATFEWAAPEQVIGQPLDGRTDVYAVGRMVCAMLGAVLYGEKTEYVVPTGGGDSRSVSLLKAGGVFIDSTALGADTRFQHAWQASIAPLIAYDPAQRPTDAAAVADKLADLASQYPPPGALMLDSSFGSIVPSRGEQWTLGRVLSDG